MVIIGGPKTSSKIREILAAAGEQQGGDVVTCESALREQGIDEAAIAKKLKDLLSAKTPRWNPGKHAFEVFDDHDTQLAAAKEIVKILGGGRPEDGEGEIQYINIPDKLPRTDRE